MAKSTNATTDTKVVTTAADSAVANTATAKVVTTTEAESNKDQTPASSNYVPVASLLQLGFTFCGLKSTSNGRYTIPGKDSDKRGANGNGKHLMLPGGAILVRVPKDVWEEIEATKQNLSIFKHDPPYLQALNNDKDFAAKMNSGEFAAVRTGLEPVKPKQPGLL